MRAMFAVPDVLDCCITDTIIYIHVVRLTLEGNEILCSVLGLNDNIGKCSIVPLFFFLLLKYFIVSLFVVV